MNRPVAKEITLILPWPPAVNNLYAVVRGRKILSKRGRDYKNMVAMIAMSNHCPRVEGRIGVIISAFPPDKRRRDLDGIIKIVLDSLVDAGVMPDDSCVDFLEVTRFSPEVGGKVRVTARSSV